MKRSVGVLLGLAAAAGALGACSEQVCTLKAPHCALRIDLQHEAWEPGTYAFRFSRDDAHAHCDVELFADPERPPKVACSDPDLVALSPFHIDHFPRGKARSALRLRLPREAHVIVEREGVEIGRGSFHPRYEVTEPNGEGCGNCENAAETLSF